MWSAKTLRVFQLAFSSCCREKKMSSWWWKFVFGIGFLSLIHSAYSAAQHRTFLRVTEQEFTFLPLDIIFQSILSLLTTMWGILHIAGDFKEIRASMELKSKSWDLLGNRPSFYTFSHRGRIFDSNLDPESS